MHDSTRCFHYSEAVKQRNPFIQFQQQIFFILKCVQLVCIELFYFLVRNGDWAFEKTWWHDRGETFCAGYWTYSNLTWVMSRFDATMRLYLFYIHLVLHICNKRMFYGSMAPSILLKKQYVPYWKVNRVVMSKNVYLKFVWRIVVGSSSSSALFSEVSNRCSWSFPSFNTVTLFFVLITDAKIDLRPLLILGLFLTHNSCIDLLQSIFLHSDIHHLPSTSLSPIFLYCSISSSSKVNGPTLTKARWVFILVLFKAASCNIMISIFQPYKKSLPSR